MTDLVAAARFELDQRLKNYPALVQSNKLTDSAARNFRSGIDAGLRKVGRIAASEGMTH